MKEPTQTSQNPQDGLPGCKLIRTSLFSDPGAGRWRRLFVKTGIHFESPWVQRHIAVCPRCQRRFAHAARVHLALSLMKSLPMELSLLGKANAKAIGSLQRSVREGPKAKALKVITSEPGTFDKIRQVRGSLAQMAACVTILILGKIGMTSSIQNIQTRGQQTLHHYYENLAGQDLADEVFPPQA